MLACVVMGLPWPCKRGVLCGLGVQRYHVRVMLYRPAKDTLAYAFLAACTLCLGVCNYRMYYSRRSRLLMLTPQFIPLLKGSHRTGMCT